MFCEYCKCNFADFPQVCPECGKQTNLYGIDLTTVNGIRSINTRIKQNVDMLNQPYYVLQRVATSYKKDNIDLAIECLRKSNEISDNFERPPLLAKDYMRLVKFLQKAKRFEEAKQTEEDLQKRHPEFWDKGIESVSDLNRKIQDAKRQGEDLLFITSSNSCPNCNKYNRQVYSISGNSTKFPKLPNELYTNSVCPDHYISTHIFFDGISTVPPEARLLPQQPQNSHYNTVANTNQRESIIGKLVKLFNLK